MDFTPPTRLAVDAFEEERGVTVSDLMDAIIQKENGRVYITQAYFDADDERKRVILEHARRLSRRF